MSTDLLRVEANQRLDYSDFDYLLNESMTAAMRDAGENFLLDPNDPVAERVSIIDGFEMTNPSGKQLTVTRGRAILPERVAGVVHYGALVAAGDASQTIDMALLASNTYGIFIRFEYVDAESGSRVFWNPAGVGSEFTQSIPTRRVAQWSMRVELASPGAEWLQIGTANNAGGSLVIVDQRNLYFEGPVNDSYKSYWSFDGGGDVNDRNADRQQYGVKDLHTFTQAMRQCIEDIKGRGLRRWWERNIGGMNIGISDLPTLNQLHVGDTDFGLRWDGTDPFFVLDENDYLFYDRSENAYSFFINSTSEMGLHDTGLRVGKGLYVGAVNVAPWDDDIRVAGGINCGGAANPAGGDGIFTRGLSVGHDGSPVDDAISVADADFGLFGSATDPSLQFKKDGTLYCRIRFDRSSEFFYFEIDNVDRMQLHADGLRVNNGLYVGGVGTAATDNEIRSEGAIHSGSRQFYFGIGSNDYISYNDTNKEFYFVIDGGTEYQFSNSTADFKGNSVLGVGAVTMGGALSGVTTLSMGGTLTGATSISMNGALSGATTIGMNGALSGATSISMNGALSGATSIDGTGDLSVGTITMTGFSVDSSGYILSGKWGYDADDYMIWTDDTLLRTYVDGNIQLDVSPEGVNVPTGMWIGYDRDTIAPLNLDLMVRGGLNVGGTANPGTQSAIFAGGGISVGFDSDPSQDSVHVGNYAFKLRWNGTDPSLEFDTGDRWEYDRSDNELLFYFGSDVVLDWNFTSTRTDWVVGDLGTSETNYGTSIQLMGKGAPAAPATDSELASFYTQVSGSNAEMWVKDGGGNTTQLSPHDAEGRWIFNSIGPDGVQRVVDMDHLIAVVEKLSNEKLVRIVERPKTKPLPGSRAHQDAIVGDRARIKREDIARAKDEAERYEKALERSAEVQERIKSAGAKKKMRKKVSRAS